MMNYKNRNNNAEAEKEINFFGFTAGTTAIEVETTLWMIALYLRNQEFNHRDIPVALSGKTLVTDTKALYGEYFTVHEVYTFGKKNLRKLESVVDKTNLSSEEETAKLVEREFKAVSPFELPLNVSEAKFCLDDLRQVALYNSDHVVKNKMPIINSSISIFAPNDAIAACVYASNIARSQLTLHKDAVANYRCFDVIPAFIEKLMAYSVDAEIFRYVERERLTTILGTMHHLMTDPTNLKDSRFITSSLIAERLFDIYIHLLPEDKERLISGIQDIFDGNRTLEDFLAEYKLTEENARSVSVIRRNLCI